MNALLHVPDIQVSHLAAGFSTGAALFAVGIALVALLTGAMWLDGRRRDEMPPPPKPEEQPKPPDHQTHLEEFRELDEDPFPHDGGRLLPYNLKNYGTHGADRVREDRPKHDDSGGAFGSGGPGG
ncbi:DUF6479 family protein [Streptomyces sp. NPDC051219]|uniref:DUF6479 family protein n=1 Tax=Streptomyces sp. NPDC051219 TaxID=3155283 RepID=UPI0034428668